jgi:hypothetical protein
MSTTTPSAAFGTAAAICCPAGPATDMSSSPVSRTSTTSSPRCSTVMSTRPLIKRYLRFAPASAGG